MAVQKKVKKIIKLQLPGAKAVPGQAIGPVLSPYKVNIKKFCDEFNEKTKDKAGSILPTEVIVYEDSTYELNIKTPVVSDLIKKALSLDKGAANSKTQKLGVLKKEKLEEIAKLKMPDLNTTSLEAAYKMVKGTARSMGITVEE